VLQSLDEQHERWYALHVNPEPWAVGPLDILRRKGKLAPTMGRNQQLFAYQQAVKDELLSKYGVVKESVYAPCYQLDCYFWRRLDEGPGTNRRHEADATNMQKALEDAIQGVLIHNDRDVIRVRSTIVEQEGSTDGKIIFCLQWGVARYGLQTPMPNGIPEEILSEIAEWRHEAPKVSDNSWPPR
jgi:hypothetical protein